MQCNQSGFESVYMHGQKCSWKALTYSSGAAFALLPAIYWLSGTANFHSYLYASFVPGRPALKVSSEEDDVTSLKVVLLVQLGIEL